MRFNTCRLRFTLSTTSSDFETSDSVNDADYVSDDCSVSSDEDSSSSDEDECFMLSDKTLMCQVMNCLVMEMPLKQQTI